MPSPDLTRRPPPWVPEALREPMQDGRLADEQAHALAARLCEHSQGPPSTRSLAIGGTRRLLITVPLAVGGEWNGGVAIFWKSRRRQELSASSARGLVWIALLNDQRLVQWAFDKSVAIQTVVAAVDQALLVPSGEPHGRVYRIPVARDERTRSEFVNLVLANTQ